MYSIRHIEYNDIFKIKDIRNEQMDVLRQSKPLTNEDQEKWYKDVILPSYKSKTTTLNFTILENNEFIGYGGFVNINYNNKNAEVSFLVKKERSENNIIYRNDFIYFLEHIIEYSYKLELHRIWTETYSFRKFHISILESKMFKYEGTLKDSTLLNGKYIDSIIHGFIIKNINYKLYFLDKTILVTGGSGLIGKDLILGLLKLSPKKVICIDIKKCPKVFGNKVEYYQENMNNIKLESIKKMNPEIIFHLAATFERTDETEDFWNENFEHNIRLNNYMGTIYKNLPNLKRVVFTSSYLIYDSDLYTSNKPCSPAIISETLPVYPRNICGASKLSHEVELKFLKKNKNFSYVSPRIFRVYGPGECGRLGGTIINRWIKLLKNDQKNKLDVFGKESMFDYVYSEDVAFGLILLCASEYEGIVNLGKGESRSIEEVVNILKNSFPDLKYNLLENKIKYESCQADMTKFYEITGWVPETSLEEGIKKCISKIV